MQITCIISDIWTCDGILFHLFSFSIYNERWAIFIGVFTYTHSYTFVYICNLLYTRQVCIRFIVIIDIS